jgi:predicted Zn-dependent protease
MRKVAMALVLAALLGGVYLTERGQGDTVIGLGAVMRLVADFQRQAERLPLTATRVSDEEEEEVGRGLAQQYGVSRSAGTEKDRALEAYVRRVGTRLSAHADRTRIPYHFYVQPEPAMNAFALPGGQVIVLRGLYDAMESEDEMAAVLGHEIAHVDRRHAIERLQYALAARKLGLSLPHAIASIPISLFQAGYNREKELEADLVGLGYAVAAGYSPQGAIDLFRRLGENEGQPTQPASTPVDEMARVVAEGPREYFRSHPPADLRIAELEKAMRFRGWHTSPVRPLAVSTDGKSPAKP